MSDPVSLSAFELQVLGRYQASLEESQRDVQKLTEARNTLLAVIWTRAGESAEEPFRVSEDGKSLVSAKQE